MKKGLFTGGRFDLSAQDCRTRIYNSTEYVPKHQTIRLIRNYETHNI